MARWRRPLVVNAGRPPRVVQPMDHQAQQEVAQRRWIQRVCVLYRHLAPSGARSTPSRPSVAQTEILRQVSQLLQRPFGLRPLGALTAAKLSELDAVLARVKASPSMDGLDLVPRVTCAAPYEWQGAAAGSWQADDDGRAVPLMPERFHVVAYDFGIKENILRQLRDVGCKVTVVPATTTAEAALALGADGFFLSNGPGDPAAVTYGIAATRGLVASGKPVFGICLGHQILALALGAKTYKLPFGHHGGNHQCQQQNGDGTLDGLAEVGYL